MEKAYICPNCNNRTLYQVYENDNVYICDDCDTEYVAEVVANNGYKFIPAADDTITEAKDVEKDTDDVDETHVILTEVSDDFLNLIPYDEFISGYIGNLRDEDIDKELKIHNKIARALKTNTDNMVAKEVSTYDSDVRLPYDWFSYELVKNLDTKNGIDLYSIDGINVVQDKFSGDKTILWFKSEEDAKHYFDYAAEFDESTKKSEDDKKTITEDSDESNDSEKSVIFKRLDKYYVTPLHNYNAQIPNARLITKCDGFGSPQEIIDYFVKWNKKSPEDFIIKENKRVKKESLDNSLKELKEDLNAFTDSLTMD